MRAFSLLSALLAIAHATSTLERREPDPQGDPWGEEPTTGISPLPPSASAGSGVSAPSGMDDMPNMAAMPPPSSGPAGGRPGVGTPKPFKEALADLYGFLPVAQVAKTIELKPVLSPTNKRAKIRFGPFTIPERGGPAPQDTLLPSMDDDGVAFLSILKGGICSNCTILSGATGLELANGTKADYNTGLYIHHLLMSDISKPMALPVSICDSATRPGSAFQRQSPFSRLNGILGSGFLGTGDNIGSSSTMFTTPDASYKSGYFIGKKDNFAVTFDLVNENPTKQEVYVALDLEWVDGHVGEDAAKMALSVAGCNLNPVKLNATGIARTVSRGYDVILDGELVFAKGQMHEGGDRMGLYLNGAKVCESVAKYGADDKGRVITEMTACPKPIPVKRGDRLALESVYDLGKRQLRRNDQELLKDPKGGYPTMGMWELTFAMKVVNQQAW